MISNHVTGYGITRSPSFVSSSDAATDDTPPRPAGALALALRGLDARLEPRNEVVDRRRGRAVLDVFAARAGRLRPEELEQLLAILVAVLLGHPVRGQCADELLGCLELAIRYRDGRHT